MLELKGSSGALHMKLALPQIIPSLTQRKFRGYVLYGNNEPLIQGLIREIVDRFSCKITSEEDLIHKLPEVTAPSLFEPVPEVILVPKAKQLTWYASFMPTLSSHTYSLVIASASSSPTFLKAPLIAAVPCYECSVEESRAILQRYVQKEHLSFDPQALSLCADLTREGQWAEVCQLLSLYGKDLITCSILNELFSTPGPDLSTLILDSPRQGGLNHLAIEEPLKIIRAWQKLLLQLWQLKVLLEKKPPEQAMKEITPPPFFKHGPKLLKAVRAWPYVRLEKALRSSLACEVELKKKGDQAFMLLSRFLQDA